MFSAVSREITVIFLVQCMSREQRILVFEVLEYHFLSIQICYLSKRRWYWKWNQFLNYLLWCKKISGGCSRRVNLLLWDNRVSTGYGRSSKGGRRWWKSCSHTHEVSYYKSTKFLLGLAMRIFFPFEHIQWASIWTKTLLQVSMHRKCAFFSPLNTMP